MKIKVKVKRFNPMEGASPEPYIQAYIIKATEGMTVLDSLLEIADNEDPTLGFRRSCRSAICGSCAVRVNGFSKLACSTQIIPEYRKKGDVLLEPLLNHNILKDLIVDFDPFWKKMDRVTPFLTPPPETKEPLKVTREDALAIDSSQKCIMCGCCNSECNALEIDRKFTAPAALAKAWRFVGDVREGEATKRLERLSKEHGIWDCVRCVHCTQYCPKDVAPMDLILALRRKAIEAGQVEVLGAKHVLEFVETRLQQSWMAQG